jgi:hypothetical protein
MIKLIVPGNGPRDYRADDGPEPTGPTAQKPSGSSIGLHDLPKNIPLHSFYSDQDQDQDLRYKNKINGTVVKVFYTWRSTTPAGTCKKLLHVCINGHQFLSRSPPTRCPRCLTTYMRAAEFEFC